MSMIYALSLLAPVLAPVLGPQTEPPVEAPPLIYRAFVQDAGTIWFEVGYRNRKPFLAEGRMIVNYVEYRLEGLDEGHDFPEGVRFKVILRDGRQGDRAVGEGTVLLGQGLRAEGVAVVEGMRFLIVPPKQP